MSTEDTQQGAARLEALAGMTAETDAASPSPEQQQAAAAEQAQEAEADQNARQWGMLMFTLGGFAQMLAPELKPVYTEDRCLMWGQQANAVAEKYGWNGPSHLPELALIASTAGFLVPSYFVISEKIKKAKEGNTPDSLITKIGLWWRTRKAKAQAMNPAPTPAPQGPSNGSQ